jgi:antitoxin (DNA-binding transcriptional repressor) of toxin-antitoxin stability system
MQRVNIQQAKTHLSRYLHAAENGEVVVLCRHNKPVAELRPLQAEASILGTPRFGLWEGFGVSDAFFEALPDDLVAAFNGE